MFFCKINCDCVVMVASSFLFHVLPVRLSDGLVGAVPSEFLWLCGHRGAGPGPGPGGGRSSFSRSPSRLTPPSHSRSELHSSRRSR